MYVCMYEYMHTYIYTYIRTHKLQPEVCDTVSRACARTSTHVQTQQLTAFRRAVLGIGSFAGTSPQGPLSNSVLLEGVGSLCVCVCACMYAYIFVYIYLHVGVESIFWRQGPGGGCCQPACMHGYTGGYMHVNVAVHANLLVYVTYHAHWGRERNMERWRETKQKKRQRRGRELGRNSVVKACACLCVRLCLCVSERGYANKIEACSQTRKDTPACHKVGGKKTMLCEKRQTDHIPRDHQGSGSADKWA